MLSEAAALATLSTVPGRILGLEGAPGTGLTRLALSMLTVPARVAPVAYVDVRGWLCPLAAWEMGISSDRLVVVRCRDNQQWPRVVSSLVEAIPAVYAELPSGVSESVLRRMTALVRARKTSMMLRPLRGGLPTGVAFRKVEALGVSWGGPDAGHGRLQRRRMLLQVSGKGLPDQQIEVEDDGSHTLRVVPRLAPAPAGRAAG